jgi:predicted ATPase
MTRLISLALHGWKTIKHLPELKLGPLNVLMGANGAGKSNLISFFRLLHAMTGAETLQLTLARMGGANACLHDGAAATSQIETRLRFSDDNSILEYSATLVPSPSDRLIFGEETYYFDNQEGGHLLQHVRMGSGHMETLLLDYCHKEDGVAEKLLEILQRRTMIYQFHNTSATARIHQRWPVADGLDLKADGGNLAAYLLHLKTYQPLAYRRIVETLRLVVPFFSDFVLSPEGDTTILRWQERGTDMVFGSHQASDGTLRIMSLVTLLLQPTESLPAIMILDEPELGLHPYAINVVAGLIQSASLHTQVILATQSTALIDYFEPEDVIVVNRRGRESEFVRLDPVALSEWLEEYSLGELWEKNVIGGRPHQ